MQRNKALRLDSKKRLILKVANEIFNKVGFERATISQIAKAADISNGSIYSYFKNKDDLLFSIPEERMENFLNSIREHLKGIKGAPNKLRKLIWHELSFYENNRDYAHLLFSDLRHNPRFSKSKAYEMVRQYGKMILQILEEGIREKTFQKEIEPYLVRGLILGSIERVAIRVFVMGKFVDTTKAAQDIYDLIYSGIGEKTRMVSLTLEEVTKLKGAKKGRIRF